MHRLLRDLMLLMKLVLMGSLRAQNLDEPILGVHDMYGYDKIGIRSTDDYGIVGASV